MVLVPIDNPHLLDPIDNPMNDLYPSFLDPHWMRLRGLGQGGGTAGTVRRCASAFLLMGTWWDWRMLHIVYLLICIYIYTYIHIIIIINNNNNSNNDNDDNDDDDHNNNHNIHMCI